MLTHIVPQSTDIAGDAVRAAMGAHFPDDVRPTLDVPLVAIENHLDRDLEVNDWIYVNQDERGALSYTTRAAVPDLRDLLAETDWHTADGRSGHHVGWYGMDEPTTEGMVRLSLLSNVRCTVYSWCAYHDANSLMQDEPDHFHKADDVELVDLDAFDGEGRNVRAVGAQVRDDGLDRYSIYVDIDLVLDRGGMSDFAESLRVLASRVERIGEAMAPDRPDSSDSTLTAQGAAAIADVLRSGGHRTVGEAFAAGAFTKEA